VSARHLSWEPALLQRHLNDWVDNVVVMDAVDSTHTCARRFIDQMEEEGLPFRPAILITREQTAGVGRGDRSWSSPSGGLYLTWIRSGIPEASVALLPILAAAAAHEALTGAGAVGLGIKWPNDLLVDGAKLGGLLVHVRHGDAVHAAVSLGLNLERAPSLPADHGRRTTCLAECLAGRSVASVADDLVVEFVVRLSMGLRNPERPFARWRDALIHQPGDAMRVRTGGGTVVEGVFSGTSPEGHVVLVTADGERTLTGGDILE
jgi:BirA family biotin operon repressor/biotin-[acetyl-CoA-carboxylase] ligase